MNDMWHLCWWRDSSFPRCADPGDVILKVTSTAICGSDLHLYLNALPGMKSGDLLGHEVRSMIRRHGSWHRLPVDPNSVLDPNRALSQSCLHCTCQNNALLLQVLSPWTF